MKLKIFSTLIVIFASFYLYINKPQKTYEGMVFGTYYKITTISKKDVSKEIATVFDTINKQMSIFNPDSNISAFNNTNISSNAELIEILRASKQVWQQSNGYFDPTIGTIIELWGFGKNKHSKPPSKKDISNTIKHCGFDKVIIKKDLATKNSSNTKINLSAIAKGYAVDAVATALDNAGIKNYLVDIGGEIKAKGTKKSSPWKIGLANPIDPSKNSQVFELSNVAVATSGNYQNFYIENGKKYSHTINPKTGYPAKNSIASATVFHQSCMMADAYATAIMAMGKQKGEAFAKKLGLKVILIEY